MTNTIWYHAIVLCQFLIQFLVKCSPVDIAIGPTVSLFQEDKTMAILEYASNGVTNCMLYDLEKPSAKRAAEQAMIQLQKPLFQTSFKDMMEIINSCRKLDYVRYPKMMQDSIGESINAPANATDLWSFWKGILPGTKWCGLGDEASDYTDIGSRFHVDSCCRAHDHCPIRLRPFAIGYKLMNLSLYTKSHCECDDEFFKCLKETKSPVSRMVGNVYFNVMKFGCMREKESSSPSAGSGREIGAIPEEPKYEFVNHRDIRF